MDYTRALAIAGVAGAVACLVCRPQEKKKAEKSITLVPGVDAAVLGREWRCKFAEGAGRDGGLINSKALEEAQRVLDDHVTDLRRISGVRGVFRIVCGGCKDFKVIMTADLDAYTAWEQADFPPEKTFVEKLGKIPGISSVETQKYTFEDMGGKMTPTGDALTLVPGVAASLLGREWRCKFTKTEGAPAAGALINSKSLEAVQSLFDSKMGKVKALGAMNVMRTVCGGCDDFKVTIVMPVKEFKEWEAKEHFPEKDFVAELGKITGVNAVETQTYTFAKLL